MIVKELIEILEAYPNDLHVVVNGYESGFDDVSPERISVIKIQLNIGTEAWEGQHEEPDFRRQGSPSTGNIVDALVFRRASN